jgi:NADPH:quinone reductase-like Zn-dependent oxidoreductase
MQAWICRRYGGPEVLTVESSSRVRVDRRLAFGLTRPRHPVLGTELAGTVEAVGRQVTAYKPGDAVIGFPKRRP